MFYTQTAYFPIWDRQTPGQKIYGFDMARGPNARATAFVAAGPAYGTPYGTIYPTVREMIVANDGRLLTVWMDATVRLDGVGTPLAVAEQPGYRIGDTARVIRYEPDTGLALWRCDAAAAVRTLEAAATTVVIQEHCAIANSPGGAILLVLSGYTITTGTYEKYHWILRINGRSGQVEDIQRIVARDPAMAVSATQDIGYGQVTGATWSPDGCFWMTAEYKFRELATTDYEFWEFRTRLYRIVETDFSVVTAFDPEPEGAELTFATGLTYHAGGCLLMPVYWFYHEGYSDQEPRTGLVTIGLDGVMQNAMGGPYPSTGDPVLENWPFVGGMCGYERQAAHFDTYDVTRQMVCEPGGAYRSQLCTLTDGRELSVYDIDRGIARLRTASPGGLLGQGANGTYNCHALTRTPSGAVAFMAYEKQAANSTDLRVRITIADPLTGVGLMQLVHDFTSADAATYPMTPQPYLWNLPSGRNALPSYESGFGDDDILPGEGPAEETWVLAGDAAFDYEGPPVCDPSSWTLSTVASHYGTAVQDGALIAGENYEVEIAASGTGGVTITLGGNEIPFTGDDAIDSVGALTVYRGQAVATSTQLGLILEDFIGNIDYIKCYQFRRNEKDDFPWARMAIRGTQKVG
jgi:hypothetical protein